MREDRLVSIRKLFKRTEALAFGKRLGAYVISTCSIDLFYRHGFELSSNTWKAQTVIKIDVYHVVNFCLGHNRCAESRYSILFVFIGVIVRHWFRFGQLTWFAEFVECGPLSVFVCYGIQ